MINPFLLVIVCTIFRSRSFFFHPLVAYFWGIVPPPNIIATNNKITIENVFGVQLCSVFFFFFNNEWQNNRMSNRRNGEKSEFQQWMPVELNCWRKNIQKHFRARTLWNFNWNWPACQHFLLDMESKKFIDLAFLSPFKNETWGSTSKQYLLKGCLFYMSIVNWILTLCYAQSIARKLVATLHMNIELSKSGMSSSIQ